MNKTLTILLAATLIVLSIPGKAQSTIVVEEVIFKGPGSDCKIPRVKDKANPNNAGVAKINSLLLDRFDLKSFNPKDAESFQYSGITFTSQVKSGLLYLEYSGEYYGAGLNAMEEILLFDLATGEVVNSKNIPFESLFTLEGYLEFMNIHWLAAAKLAFKEAIACAETEPYCSYYDIEDYFITDSRLSFSISSDCYPQVARYCGPGLSRSVPMDSVKLYLSPLGEKILVRDAYSAKRGIDRYLYNNQAGKELPDNVYIFGLIDDKYPFSMAVNINASGAMKGFYYYDKRKQKITLAGTAQQTTMQLKETVNGQVTGEFSLQWHTDYPEYGFSVYDSNGNFRYLSGKWKSPDGKKVLPITFTEVKFTGRKIF